MSKPVCMAVLHYGGRFYRAYRGRRVHNHVLNFEQSFISPGFVYMWVRVDGDLIYQGSRKLSMLPGRRYPDVVHWFVVEASQLDVKRHYCACEAPELNWGPAVVVCQEHDDGTLWAGNGEYESQVNYCPWCGYKARVPVRVPIEK